MEAKELRIGNLVIWNPIMRNGMIATKSDKNIVAMTSYSLYTFYNKNNRWKPIPLSEELLLKLGLKRVDVQGIYYEIEIGKLRNCLQLYDGKWTWDFNSTWEIEIKYVHEFQNLIFCLTGEELSLKETVQQTNG